VQKNGQEISCDFFFPSEFIDVYDSSTLHLPSPVNIQLLADSVLYSVEWERWEILVKRYPVLTEIEKIIIACYNKALRERIIDFQSLKAKDRYIKLLQTNHYLLQQASIAQIASYMGVKVETLSRIRTKIIHLKF
jgi:CRP-like cAMP-binding protein